MPRNMGMGVGEEGSEFIEMINSGKCRLCILFLGYEIRWRSKFSPILSNLAPNDDVIRVIDGIFYVFFC